MNIQKIEFQDEILDTAGQSDNKPRYKIRDNDGNVITDTKYIYPEEVCPKCGKVIPEEEQSPDRMLFMRHQLGLMNKM